MALKCLSPRWLLAFLVIAGYLYSGTEEEINDPLITLVAANGYPLEMHSTKTADGYILGMHRIPFAPKSPAAPNKPVVFLMHGIQCSSYTYVFLGKDNSLAFLLADSGYDVWLGNSRGNEYARSNVFVSSDSPAFWQFSWHERGTLDLPAMIDYVLQETGQQKLSYVSHSRGGPMFYVMMDALPKYNDKIKIAVHMAPNVFMTKPASALKKIFARWSRLLEWISVFVGVNEVRSSPTFSALLDIDRCRNGPHSQFLCDQPVFLTGGLYSRHINKRKLVDISKSRFIGTSVKEFVHSEQLATSKRFAKYDYGFIGNVAHYGSLLPPSYDLGKVTAPVVVINTKDDILATQEETDVLLNGLPNLVNHILIEDPVGFLHVDFVFSDYAKTIVYDKILAELKKYETHVEKLDYMEASLTNVCNSSFILPI